MKPRLFAVYLGGRAPRAGIELHDMVFVAGDSIEECYGQILDKWFGTPGDVHIDSVLELDIVDGWRIELQRSPAPPSCEAQEGAAAVAGGAPAPVASEGRRGPMKLWFVNLGAYDASGFTELHAASFHVAAEAPQAKAAALARHFTSGVTTPHKDDLIEIDDCLAVEGANGWQAVLTRTNAVSAQKPSNRYQAIPEAVLAAWLGKRG